MQRVSQYYRVITEVNIELCANISSLNAKLSIYTLALLLFTTQVEQNM